MGYTHATPDIDLNRPEGSTHKRRPNEKSSKQNEITIKSIENDIVLWRRIDQ